MEFQPFQSQLLDRSPDLVDCEWMLRICAGKSDEFFRVSCDDFRYVIICSRKRFARLDLVEREDYALLNVRLFHLTQKGLGQLCDSL